MRYLLSLWVLVISYVFLSPASGLPSYSFLDWPHNDKLLHFLSFGILAALFRLAFKGVCSVYAGIICAVYGLLIELIQVEIPGRSFEWLDWVADLAGTLAGSLAFTYFNSRKI